MAEYNPYETRRLVAVIADLVRPSTFLLTTFFRNFIGPTGTKKIMFDVDSRNAGIAVFCSPLANGRPVRERGWVAKEIEPAYLKPWMPFDPYGPLMRMIGEQPSGDMTAGQRQQARLVRGFSDLQEISFRRMEVMAGEALITGKNIISGEGIDQPIQVDYGRKATFTIQLVTTARWGETGVSPVTNVETWNQNYVAENGYAPNTISFDPLSWGYFRADPLFDKHIDINYRRQAAPPGQSDTLMLGDGRQGQLMGQLRSGSNIELWVYQQSYLDSDATTKKVVPDNSVIMGSTLPELTQTQCFGTIIDPELGYESQLLRDPATGARLEFAPKHWFAQPPAVGECIMLQSAPLTALTRPNATLGAIVR